MLLQLISLGPWRHFPPSSLLFFAITQAREHTFFLCCLCSVCSLHWECSPCDLWRLNLTYPWDSSSSVPSMNTLLISLLVPTEIGSSLPAMGSHHLPPPWWHLKNSAACVCLALGGAVVLADQKCSPQPLFTCQVKPQDREWSMGDGVDSEVKMGSGFLNPAAGSQGEWLSVAPNLRITCLSLFITQRVSTRKSKTWV